MNGRLVVGLRLRFATYFGACVVLLSACGFPRAHWEFHRALLDADRLADEGQYALAEEEYLRLAPDAYRDDLMRYVRYRVALMQEKDERYDEALESYAAIYLHPYNLHDELAGRALFRSANIVGEYLGDEEERIHMLTGLMTGFPNSAAADDALWELLDLFEERGDYMTLLNWFADIYPGIQDTELADTVVYRTARILHVEMERYEEAIEVYGVVARRFHRSGFWDDAVWYSAECYAAMGDTDSEYWVLMTFVEGREVSWVMADYDSGYYGDAYWRLAEIHEEREEWSDAIAVWRRWQRRFPLSLKIDDIQYHIMELQLADGDIAGMRSTLDWLIDNYPDSRFIDDGEALLAEARR